MTKKLHVNCFLVGNSQAEAFRQLVRTYNEPAGGDEEYQASGFVEPEPSVEILYEETGRDTTGFDLWFATPATGFYFGVAWGQRRAELIQQPAVAPTYPQFLYDPRRHIWLRYNSPKYFCLVSESQLQVRRERPQELFKPEEVEVITEAAFLENYKRISTLLRERVQNYMAVFQRRGSAGNEWFYCNPLYAGKSSNSLELHLRLNVSADEHGRTWQLLYAHDTNRNDSRRVAIPREEFEQQLQQLLREAEAAATGQEGQLPLLPAQGLSEEEAEDFYLNGDPFDGTFSELGEDHDDI